MSPPPSYFISAGEYSGDLIAADLVEALKSFFPKHRAIGMTGEAMRTAGVEELADFQPISVMGVTDVAKKLGQIRQVESYLLAKIDECRPQFAVLVDFPKFHFRLAEQLRLRGIPVIQYVAPKLWAWGAGRVEKLRRDFDKVLGVLPFEEEFFKTNDVHYEYVGSPLVDRIASLKEMDLPFVTPGDKLVGILPGSRLAELKLILPRIVSIIGRLQRRRDDLSFVMPLAANLSPDDLFEVLSAVDSTEQLTPTPYGWQWRQLHVVRGSSLEIMQASSVAIVASGTATLECALLNTPQAVVYCVTPFTYEIAKHVVQIKYVSLVNLIARKEVVREFIQEFAADDVATEIEALLTGARRDVMLQEYKSMFQKLSGNAAARAASSIFNDFGPGSP